MQDWPRTPRMLFPNLCFLLLVQKRPYVFEQLHLHTFNVFIFKVSSLCFSLQDKSVSHVAGLTLTHRKSNQINCGPPEGRDLGFSLHGLVPRRKHSTWHSECVPSI